MKMVVIKMINMVVVVVGVFNYKNTQFLLFLLCALHHKNSVQRQQAVSATPVNTQSTNKRPFSESQSAPNLPPLAQRIRSDFQTGGSENESPEKELLRSLPCPELSPSHISSSVKEIPPPAPLVFTRGILILINF